MVRDIKTIAQLDDLVNTIPFVTVMQHNGHSPCELETFCDLEATKAVDGTLAFGTVDLCSAEKELADRYGDEPLLMFFEDGALSKRRMSFTFWDTLDVEFSVGNFARLAKGEVE